MFYDFKYVADKCLPGWDRRCGLYAKLFYCIQFYFYGNIYCSDGVDLFTLNEHEKEKLHLNMTHRAFNPFATGNMI